MPIRPPDRSTVSPAPGSRVLASNQTQARSKITSQDGSRDSALRENIGPNDVMADEKIIKPGTDASGSLYVITAYRFNHVQRSVPIDERFFEPGVNSRFYFVDEAGAPPGFQGQHIEEREVNPGITSAGSRLIAEWSFLLTELEKPFAKYPFYVVSSRFFEKNRLLEANLQQVLAAAFSLLEHYGWGYLPSYNRNANFQDLHYYKEVGYLGIKDEGIAFVDGFYGVRFVDQYRLISDFFCNYIGFRLRQHFVAYMNFYVPFIRRFFDAQWNVIRQPELYVRNTHTYRSEKPFTFLLEMISHLFFYMNDLKFCGVSYDGIYEVNERATLMKPLMTWGRVEPPGREPVSRIAAGQAAPIR
jgi:hypothetical protein